MEIKEIESKSILTPSKLPDTDYVINPYTGCAFGCTYCYASFMSRYIGKDINDWGDYVYIKINAPELLKKDLKSLKNNGKDKTIFFSSVTDPYQGMEAKYQLTRKCLQVLLDFGFEGNVSILTKSHMVLRDIDLFKQFKNIEVGLTITSFDDSISRYFEKKAPNVSQRLEALKELNASGIKTYAFVGPLLPHYVSQPDVLDELFNEISKTGTKELYVEHINLSTYILERLKKEMPSLEASVIEKFYSSRKSEYREDLDVLVKALVEKYKFHLKTESTLYHKDLKN
jgi:DNA repair photolyase